MSASLIVMIPVGLFGLVTALCFVGCVLNTHGSGFGPYEDPISNDADTVACWPLNETLGTTAFDIKNQFNGTYTSVPGTPYDPVTKSAAADGTFTLNQSGIVPGDIQINGQSPCAAFNGGFVQVPFHPELNPEPPFTLEAWVLPQWTFDPTLPAIRTVVESAIPSSGMGYDLFATAGNFWAAAVGTPSGVVQTQPLSGSQPIAPNTPFFLVMTYDGAMLTLWVNPLSTTAIPYAQAAATGFNAVPSAVPLVIGTGRPDLLPASTANPFNGKIQDVAFYGKVLDMETIVGHFLLGAG